MITYENQILRLIDYIKGLQNELKRNHVQVIKEQLTDSLMFNTSKLESLLSTYGKLKSNHHCIMCGDFLTLDEFYKYGNACSNCYTAGVNL